MGLFNDYNVSLSRFMYGDNSQNADNKNTSFSFFNFPNIFGGFNYFTYSPLNYTFPAFPTNFMMPFFSNISAGVTNFYNTQKPIITPSISVFSNNLIGELKIDTFQSSQSTVTSTAQSSAVTTKNKTSIVKKSNSKVINRPYVQTVTLNGVEIQKFSHVNIDKLQPDMKEKLVALSQEAAKHGYTLVANDCYRSASVQAAAKREKPNLCASPNKSPHQYGCAFDLTLYDPNGRQVDISTVPWFYNYAKKDLNLTWGQDWNSKKESWHFERKGWNKYGSDVYLAYCKNNNITPKQSAA